MIDGAELAELGPGPALASALAVVDRSRVDALTVLAAQARQVAHEQAGLLAVLVQVAEAAEVAVVGGAGHVPGEFAADEIAVALCWTRQAAQAQLAFARDVVGRLPVLWAALHAGHLDVARVRRISDVVAVLPDELARRVVDRVVDAAADLTTGQLAARLRRLVIAADPQAAARRERAAVADRRLVTDTGQDGTAMLAGYGLPVHRAAAAAERIAAIAAAAKATGDPRSLDQLRADTFLDLLDGTLVGPHPAPRRGVVELRVDLATLTGASDAPGELAGWGPVTADLARQLAAAKPPATWRWSAYDRRGLLRHHGLTRRRPTSADAELVRARDRTCRAPGCRVPARRCDLDHTRPWATGGATTPANLAALCRHHHRMKDQGGWRLRPIAPGVLAWTSPLGQTRLVCPEPRGP